MLAKADTDHCKDGVSQLDKHLDALTRFLEQAEATAHPETRGFTLIIRSAESDPARAVVAMAQELAAAGIRPRIVLAKLEPSEALRELADALSRIYSDGMDDAVRWAKNPKLLDAHEQATYGADLCWSGDAMGRDPSRRNALSLFAEGTPDMVRLAKLSFSALWSASSEVSERRLRAGAAEKALEACGASSDNTVWDAALARPAVPAWPLIRH
ncbi:hypothetical protein V6C03_06070 [Methyloligella sp. 2.7D]|uniref:hypothetical protein n=1 Tax=unclassified Methyloligella TaxID=2625955 RepID=UPI00157BE998|nr:hypothetical protein [Methyloligella sp. GL2]QKP78521.1 hypothetical protein HT051_14385 [Methyloligella sp. GL2]